MLKKLDYSQVVAEIYGRIFTELREFNEIRKEQEVEQGSLYPLNQETVTSGKLISTLLLQQNQ